MTTMRGDTRHPVTSGAGGAATSAAGLRGPAARAHRRQTMLDAAQEVFVAHGYHGAKMDEISARSGISKPVLYDHFASKLDLYLVVLQLNLDRMVDGVRVAVAADTEPRSRVRGAVQAYFDFVEYDLGGYVLVFESPVPSEPCVEWRVRNAMRDCAVLVSAELRAVGVDATRADIHAWGLVGLSRLAASHWLEAGRPISKKDAVDTASALCWNGLSTVDRQQEEHR
ncbi:TetR/AcrR family transcriptional regulator [Nocardia salmonicida]|uniref:TetR/AcrR family transcriptional regulator n=1 Tax=Nocardia salmonicida TaxID=53431 RepID=UPI002E29FB20|nr:TetR/AcrR family transcriptional regulator [Nocardia salmonicida]